MSPVLSPEGCGPPQSGLLQATFPRSHGLRAEGGGSMNEATTAMDS